MSEGAAYVLGSDDEEIARLDGQARSIAGATEALLRAAGIGGAMRVLDLGTGLGHVALLVAGLLETEGSVLGVDQSGRLLEIAERRRVAAGAENVSFVQSDARTFTADEPFDAIVARLLLFHLPDREELLRRQLEALRPGGKMVVIEFDIGAMRAEPEVPLVTQVRGWIEAAFRSAGADRRPWSARGPAGDASASGRRREPRPAAAVLDRERAPGSDQPHREHRAGADLGVAPVEARVGGDVDDADRLRRSVGSARRAFRNERIGRHRERRRRRGGGDRSGHDEATEELTCAGHAGSFSSGGRRR